MPLLCVSLVRYPKLFGPILTLIVALAIPSVSGGYALMGDGEVMDITLMQSLGSVK